MVLLACLAACLLYVSKQSLFACIKRCNRTRKFDIKTLYKVPISQSSLLIRSSLSGLCLGISQASSNIFTGSVTSSPREFS
ncbi:hypothetical protein F0562_020097 [Nyssa sinensis]|uniref:Secreted protein n=1 Tax=Nyssa sinensis TaxID=561372 RepID=A0A5J5BQ72_9ASTE|nr:hypothetical protein F0562_020097 [Nyssa sinensis]